ncbi:MAG TPA: phage portal protein [Tepidisphaeraceae bacterium]|nr:phage portal protein [Tepidisphaeraceae bacterium]
MPRRNPYRPINRATAPEMELPAEKQARRLRAQVEVMALQATKKRMREGQAALSIHAAADTGRRNTDWRANNASADLANIPDSPVMIGRARQLDRDSWLARSAKKSFVRNVVGKGIQVIPHAKDPKGKPLTQLNLVVARLWHRWCLHCDIERRKSFNQMQRLAAADKFIAGEHLWMWSYKFPGLLNEGIIDRNQPVGLRLQAFEAEQFDLRILSYAGREVRGGVEVDENGAPLAYHIYTRNPNDVLYRHAFFSERVPRQRMFHYFDQERVLQTRGVTGLSPVMADMRDISRVQTASIWRMEMESCIGLIIEQPMPGNNIGPATSFGPPTNGSGQTPSGMNEIDFVPGMVARTVPGEKVQSLVPQSPGNQYNPFMETTVRGIGAALGQSYGQIARRNDSNYSAARQDMLEDRKEQEPEQQLFIDAMVRPAYELFFNWAVMEGRLDGIEGFSTDEFLADRFRYVEADYLPPSQSWIDPEKEANAFVILLKNRLITREEIVALRGGRYSHVIEKLAEEKNLAENRGLTLPENDDERNNVRELVKAAIENRQGTVDAVSANLLDLSAMFQQGGLPVQKNYTQPLLPVQTPTGGTITGDPVTNKAGKVIGGGVEEPAVPAGGGGGEGESGGGGGGGNGAAATPAPKPGGGSGQGVHVHVAMPAAPAPKPPGGNGNPSTSSGQDGNGKGKNGKTPAKAGGRIAASAAPGGGGTVEGVSDFILQQQRGSPAGGVDVQSAADRQARDEVAGGPWPLPQVPPPSVPNYRQSPDEVSSCATCSFANGSRCTMFNFIFDPSYVCDKWIARTLTENIGVPNTAKTFPPGPQPGQIDLESRFYPDSDPYGPFGQTTSMSAEERRLVRRAGERERGRGGERPELPAIHIHQAPQIDLASLRAAAGLAVQAPAPAQVNVSPIINVEFPPQPPLPTPLPPLPPQFTVQSPVNVSPIVNVDLPPQPAPVMHYHAAPSAPQASPQVTVESPIINVEPSAAPQVTVQPPVIHLHAPPPSAAPDVYLEAPVVNLAPIIQLPDPPEPPEPPQITVEAPIVNVAAPVLPPPAPPAQVNVEAPIVNVTVPPRAPGIHTIVRDADGLTSEVKDETSGMTRHFIRDADGTVTGFRDEITTQNPTPILPASPPPAPPEPTVEPNPPDEASGGEK